MEDRDLRTRIEKLEKNQEEIMRLLKGKQTSHHIKLGLQLVVFVIAGLAIAFYYRTITNLF